MKLIEAISARALDSHLEKYRTPVESKLKGEIGKYVLSLELVLDMLAQTSSKSDNDLASFMSQVDRNISKMSPGAKKKGTSRATSGEPATQPEKGGTPSLASLAASEKGKPTPPPIQPGAGLKKPKDYKPYKSGEEGSDDWSKWMKKTDPYSPEQAANWKPEKLPGSPSKKIGDKKKKEYDLDVKRSREKKLSLAQMLAKKGL